MGAAAAAVVLAAGCGKQEVGSTSQSSEASSPPRTTSRQTKTPPGPRFVSVTLDGSVSPTNVGILMAEERGYFADAGLSVSATVPIRPKTGLRYVLQGGVDFAVLHGPEASMAKERGARIAVVGKLIREPTEAMIWLRGSGIRSVADLKGKTIGYPGLPSQEALLRQVLERAGIGPDEVKIKNTSYYLVPMLVRGRVDAIFGGSWNLEGVVLRTRGLDPVVVQVQSLGAPAYDELVLAMQADRAVKEPRLVRNFMEAVRRGVRAAAKHPQAAVITIETSSESNPEASRKATAAELRATLPLLAR
jgi:ABC-type nitrate/sulfonate/bicarbonate transport system substrate-binding protein